MSEVQNDFEELLNRSTKEKIAIPKFTKELARKLLYRINHIKLYAHSYAFTSHSEHGVYDVLDFLEFAHQQELGGIAINIDFGEEKPLENMDESGLEEVKELANKYGLKIMLDISSTKKDEIDKVVEVAKTLNVQNIRVYNRCGGYLSDSIRQCIIDLKYACEIADRHDLRFAIESHEAMKSHELANIVREVGSPRLGILFDFGNMINANERPLEALKGMSPHIRWAHIKDVKIKPDRSGYAHLGVRDGTGDIPQLRMLYDLLMLGDTEPQVEMFALQQVSGYEAPAYRFDGEGENPKIPAREPSETRADAKLSRDENLRIEKENAIHQVKHVKRLLGELRKIAQRRLESTL